MSGLATDSKRGFADGKAQCALYGSWIHCCHFLPPERFEVLAKVGLLILERNLAKLGIWPWPLTSRAAGDDTRAVYIYTDLL